MLAMNTLRQTVQDALRSALGKTSIYLFCLCLFAILVISVPENHTEAEDAFDYATQAEKSNGLTSYHVRHLLYIPFAHVAYVAASNFGIAGRSYDLMILISIVASVLTVLIYVMILRDRLRLPSRLAFLSALFLISSYGFWRYSVEAEVYALASLFVVLLLYMSLAERQTYLSTFLLGISAGLGVLVHLMNLIPAGIGCVLLFVRTRKPLYPILYTLVSVTIVLLTYLLAFGSFVPIATLATERGAVVVEGGISISDLLKSFVGFGQSLYSGNFLFAYEPFRSKIIALFPYRMLQEEMFMGYKAPAAAVFMPIITLPAIAFGWLFLVYQVIVSRKEPATRGNMVIKTFSLWLLLYAVILTLYEPSNPEGWILVLIPFWIFITHLILVRLPRTKLAFALILLVFTVLHNFFGGYLLIRKSDGDYNYQKAKWFIENTTSNDCILTLDNEVFTRFLRYHSKSRVLNLYTRSANNLDSMREILNDVPGVVYSTGDVVNPPTYIKHLNPHFFQAYSKWLESHQQRFLKIIDTQFGGIYVFRSNNYPR